MDQRGVAQVVQAVRAEDLSASLEPDSLAEGDAVLGQELWGHTAQGAEHGPAGVDDLDLTVTAGQVRINSQVKQEWVVIAEDSVTQKESNDGK